MKTIIKKLKQMDKTKRIVIYFITISFVLILGIGAYQGFKQPVVLQAIKQVEQNDSTEQEETPKKDSSKDDEETLDEKQTTQQEETKKESKKETKENTKTDESIKKEEPVQNENITISIQVTGINETLISETMSVKKESTAFSILKEVTTNKGMKISTSGFGPMVYVTGIGELKEKQHGSSSGWMYKVNNVSPNIGAGSYQLKENDQVLWYYVYSE